MKLCGIKLFCAFKYTVHTFCTWYLTGNIFQVVERMANNLEVAGRQRNHMNGRGARLRSALELLHMINPFNLNCLLQLARFYMLYNMDIKPLMKIINDLQPVSVSYFKE